jgi:hypothetical protein
MSFLFFLLDNLKSLYVFLFLRFSVRYCQLVFLFSVPLLFGIEGKLVHISSALLIGHQKYICNLSN